MIDLLIKGIVSFFIIIGFLITQLVQIIIGGFFALTILPLMIFYPIIWILPKKVKK